jgi:hypothetical protein
VAAVECDSRGLRELRRQGLFLVVFVEVRLRSGPLTHVVFWPVCPFRLLHWHYFGRFIRAFPLANTGRMDCTCRRVAAKLAWRLAFMGTKPRKSRYSALIFERTAATSLALT